jgi:hypothetical protein
VLELVPRSGSEEVKEELTKALARADECDSVIVVMQKKTSGVIWFGNGTVATAVLLLESMKHRLMEMMKN